ncbi:MAG: hypothetical protein LIP03_05005 [Bacteroidales bacterium]|nr:hypothetical protein [Bacteroidales bacterium]
MKIIIHNLKTLIFVIPMLLVLMASCTEDIEIISEGEVITGNLKLSVDVSDITSTSFTVTGTITSGEKEYYRYYIAIADHSFTQEYFALDGSTSYYKGETYQYWDETGEYVYFYALGAGEYSLTIDSSTFSSLSPSLSIDPQTTYYVAFVGASTNFDTEPWSEVKEITTAAQLSKTFLSGGLWTKGNSTIEFKPYGIAFFRTLSGSTATLDDQGTFYLNSSDQIVYTSSATGRQSIYDVTNWDLNTLTPVDYQGNTTTYTRQNTDMVNFATFVDLGLPSGTLWLDRNLGAFTQEEDGWLLAWGELEEKATYDYSTSLYDGTDIGSNIQMTQYDGAYNYSSNWCMPTSAQFEELDNNCEISYDSESGCHKVTGTNGKYILFPSYGYWSANSESSSFALEYSFNYGMLFCYASGHRYNGYRIRPVRAQ